MTLDPATILALLALGGWVASDATGFGQFMVSRPFVAASVAGWIAGDAVAGVTVGVVLEAFHLAVLPVGAARYPEGGPPAVVAGALYAASGQLPSTLLMCTVFALAWDWIAGESVRIQRQINVRIVVPKDGDEAAPLQRRHLTALLLDVLRGVLLVGVGLLLLGALLKLSLPQWRLAQPLAALAVAAATAGLLASALRLFSGRARFFVAGAVMGLLLLWARL